MSFFTVQIRQNVFSVGTAWLLILVVTLKFTIISLGWQQLRHFLIDIFWIPLAVFPNWNYVPKLGSNSSMVTI